MSNSNSIQSFNTKVQNFGTTVEKSKAKQTDKNTENSEKEGMSNSVRLMLGATALAGIVAIGIIGHKNNWWRSASKKAEDVVGTQSGTHATSGSANSGGTHLESSVPPVLDNPEFVKNIKLINGTDGCPDFQIPLANGGTLNVSRVMESGSYDGETIFGYPKVQYSIKNNAGEETFNYVVEHCSGGGEVTKFKLADGSFVRCDTRGNWYNNSGRILEKDLNLEILYRNAFKDLPKSVKKYFSERLRRGTVKSSDGSTTISYSRYFRSLNKDFDNGTSLVVTKPHDGSPKTYTLTDGGGNCVYRKIDGTSESFSLGDKKYSSKVVTEPGEDGALFNVRKFTRDGKEISQEEFEKMKRHVIASALPNGVSSKFARETSCLRNANGDYVMPHEFRSNEFTILDSEFKRKYMLTLNDDGNLENFKRFNSEGKIVEKGVSCDDGEITTHIVGENGEKLNRQVLPWTDEKVQEILNMVKIV